MGEVYKARDTQLDRDVAIKVVRSSRTDQAPAGELLDEARAASRLNHPHVCTIHEVFELDGRSHIVMEFAAGRLLEGVHPSRRPADGDRPGLRRPNRVRDRARSRLSHRPR